MSFTLQGFGPFLHWLALGVLCVFPIVIAVVIYKLGGLPGAIAASRGHPQAEAIKICGWMGIVTIVLWPLALVWAHLRPGEPPGGVQIGAPDDDAALLAKLRQLSQRATSIEAQLAKQPSGRT